MRSWEHHWSGKLKCFEKDVARGRDVDPSLRHSEDRARVEAHENTSQATRWLAWRNRMAPIGGRASLNWAEIG